MGQNSTTTALRPAILIADDDPAVRRVMSLLLATVGRVIEACDGVEALEMARRHFPDLVVCDFQMPRLHGGAVIEAMKLERELVSIPVILTSGYSEEEVLGDDNDGVVFLAKPFSAIELLELVRHALRDIDQQCCPQKPATRNSPCCVDA